MKKKVLPAILALVFLWLVVTAYFYSQHLLVVQEYPVYTTAEAEDNFIIIKNIYAYNFKRKPFGFDVSSPWYWRVSEKIKNRKTRNMFLGICSFYSRPYVFDQEKRTIKLQGIIAMKDIKNNFDSLHESPYEIIIYGDYDIRLTDGWGGSHQGNSNIFYIESVCEDVLLKSNHTYKIVIKDREKGDVIKELPFKPEWKITTYNFFNRKLRPQNFEGIEPESMLYKFINYVVKHNQKAAANYIYYKAKEDFPWKYLNHDYLNTVNPGYVYYIGNYLSYNNVFSIELLYFEPGAQVLSLDDAVAKQTLYFIDRIGTWQIIDVSPLLFSLARN